MKYLKKFENADIEILSRFTQAIASFLNEIKPELKFYSVHNYNKYQWSIYINNAEIIFIGKSGSLNRTILLDQMNYYFEKKEIQNFMEYIPPYLSNIDTLIFIEKLTKEQYERFLIQIEADKYNL
jgi:hypothetical protein